MNRQAMQDRINALVDADPANTWRLLGLMVAAAPDAAVRILELLEPWQVREEQRPGRRGMTCETCGGRGVIAEKVVDCEGSAQPGEEHLGDILCRECGHRWPVLRSIDGHVVPYHQRRSRCFSPTPGDGDAD